MRIETIQIKNFKVFRDVLIKNIQPCSVFIGANGAGKSTFFDVFGFLRDCLKDNVRIATQKRGGFKELVSRNCINENICIEIKFRTIISGKDRLVTYSIEIGEENRNVIVKKERLSYKRKSYGHPFYFLDFEKGAGQAITNEEQSLSDEEMLKEFQKLDSPDVLAIKGLGQFQKFIAASAIRSLVENWHVSDFQVSSARPSKDVGYAEHLSPEGDNLPLVTQFMYENHRAVFNRILDAMKRRIPGISNVESAQTDDGRIILKFQDGSFKDPFIGRYVSDGTIKMFAYLILLYDPNPHPLLCVEEPENQLYPTLLKELSEEFVIYSQNKGAGQVFVSTHSPDFLDAVDINNAFFIKKINGYSEVFKANSFDTLVAYTKSGETLGALWRQGAFEGIDPR